MAKNQKTAGSNKIVATLPYLAAPSDEQIDQMEIEFSLRVVSQNETHEESFFQWMMEIDFAIVDEKMDSEICTLMENRFNDRIRRQNSLTQEEVFLFDDLMDSYPDPVYSHADYIEDEKEYERFLLSCPEQEIVRGIPLRGLKTSVRKELIREYCVH
jgi:hypothetical protein